MIAENFVEEKKKEQEAAKVVVPKPEPRPEVYRPTIFPETPEDDELEGLTGLDLALKRYDLQQKAKGKKWWRAKTDKENDPVQSQKQESAPVRDTYRSELHQVMPPSPIEPRRYAPEPVTRFNQYAF